MTISTTKHRDYFISGNVAVAAGVQAFVFPEAATVKGISMRCGTAPATTAIICDVNKNGTTIFTTQANRPMIAAAATATAAEVTNMDVTEYAAGDYLTVDVDQIGTGTVGANLAVCIRYQTTP